MVIHVKKLSTYIVSQRSLIPAVSAAADHPPLRLVNQLRVYLAEINGKTW